MPLTQLVGRLKTEEMLVFSSDLLYSSANQVDVSRQIRHVEDILNKASKSANNSSPRVQGSARDRILTG